MKEVTQKHIKGYLYLIVVIILYVFSPFLTKETYRNSATQYCKPFFINYFCTACYIFYYLPTLYQNVYNKITGNSEGNKEDEAQKEKYSDWEILKITTLLGIVQFVHTVAYYYAIKYTSIASNFILHDTSDVFVFIFCICILKWTFSWVRLSAVFISVLGISFIAYSDSSDNTQKFAILGDIIGLSSTLLYALHITLTKRLIEDEDSLDWSKFFYYQGISMTILFFPVLLILHFTGLETFEMPNFATLILLLINGIFAYDLPDYCLNLATVLLDPLLVDLGLGALSPISMVIDYFFENKTFDLPYLSGYSFVVLAFGILVYYDMYYEIEDQVEKSEKKQITDSELKILVK